MENLFNLLRVRSFILRHNFRLYLHIKMQEAKDQLKDIESKVKQLEAEAKDPKKQSDKAQQLNNPQL